MNSQISTPLPAPLRTPTGELTQRLSCTPRGARLARRLAAQQLADWGHPHDSDVSYAAQHVVAELAANAVTHGRVPGRDFELRILLFPEDTLRIEVSDTRGDRQLRIVPRWEADEGGLGLVIVSVLAGTWGVAERDIGKTVWVELPLKDRGLLTRRPFPIPEATGNPRETPGRPVSPATT
ncbi:ATP-binding protein [Streptomyces sp. NPDC005474]|uniref:ATP-binding protein n=1 Tax=Streptomyces sp. NPDC005474 TaxID=3154878 RepID=UPI003454E7E3